MISLFGNRCLCGNSCIYSSMYKRITTVVELYGVIMLGCILMDEAI